ncbi:MAG: hypothetical protein JJ713_06205 [Acidithiobacillus sp.]|jgi:hypothetical protein|uniref:pilus assembly protein TadG-related protein n=1 Tax=Acidithiobacillus sp. TaxID=1872118 RepID=UPI002587D5B2|nr:pilus assembly protein TadG-related protein [Acidithiobacillus sp.]MCE5420362.1 hypothetical protein [Acidithiobacillus sp.]
MANSRSNQQRDGARRRWRFLLHRPRGESGQAAIVAVLLIPAAIAGVLLVFNTGQVTANKLKVQNAADAAAYAAMDLQARQMNLDAYLNRAMLTNQIAMGQAVSIVSWSRYVGHVGENIKYPFAIYKGIAHLIDIFLPGVGSALAQGLDGYQKLIEVAAKTAKISGEAYGTYIGVGNLYDALYAGASQAFNLALGESTPKGAVQQTVVQVVKLNAGPNARVLNYDSVTGYATLIAPYWNARRNYVTDWGGNADAGGRDPGGRPRMASMIMEGSRDFVKKRDHDVGFPLSFSFTTFGLPPGVRAGTYKGGGSQLAMDASGNYVWSGADTISTGIDVRGFCGRIFPRPCWQNIYSQSWGWGGAWSEPALGTFNYYRSDFRNRNWSYPYMDQNSAVPKSLTSRAGVVYRNDWSRDGRGMNQVVRDYSGKLLTDSLPDFGVGRGAHNHKGIARYRDLKWQTTDSSGKSVTRDQVDLTDTAPRYVVVVDLPRNNVRDSATALGISHDPDANNPRLGWLNMHLETQGAGRNPGVRAAAAAQVYFRRPAELWPRRIDGLDERANLFSPFWTVRLVDLTAQERALVLALNQAE